MYEAVGICLPGSLIGSANDKAAGKARISAAQDSGTASKRCVVHEVMDLIHSPPQRFPRWWVGGVNLEPPFSLSVILASLTRVRYSLSSAYKAKQHERGLCGGERCIIQEGTRHCLTQVPSQEIFSCSYVDRMLTYTF